MMKFFQRAKEEKITFDNFKKTDAARGQGIQLVRHSEFVVNTLRRSNIWEKVPWEDLDYST